MDYAHYIYGKKLSLPSTDDVQDAFKEYVEDASVRLKAGKLRPGEEARTMPDGRVQKRFVRVCMDNSGRYQVVD